MIIRLAILCIACSALVGAELELRSVEWGISGRVRPDGFAPLHLLIHNNGQQAVDGVLELVVGDPVVGAPEISEFHLDPGRERWVRFTPWMSQGYVNDVALRWRGGTRIATLPAPQFSQPTAALLVSDADPPRRTRLPRLAAERFPDTPSLLDALGCLVVDQVPRWDAQRAATLAQWVHLGGTLVLLTGLDGAALRAEAIAPNLHAGVNGRGLVATLALPREDCGLAELAAIWTQPSRSEIRHAFAERAILLGFTQLVRPTIAWSTITVVLVLCALLIGPLPWWLGRRGRDWRWIQAIVVVAIIGSSVATWWLGRRGYGENAAMHAIAIARVAGDSVAEVEQRSSVFVTASGQRTIAHAAPRNLYACPAAEHGIDGVVTAVGPGAFATNIPLFTSRQFVHRGVLGLRPPAIDSVSNQTKGYEVRFVDGTRVRRLASWDGAAFQVLQEEAGRWVSSGKRTKPDELYEAQYSYSGQRVDVHGLLAQNLLPLCTRALRGPAGDLPDQPALFAQVDAPADACQPISGLSEGFHGTVLWRIELPAPLPKERP